MKVTIKKPNPIYLLVDAIDIIEEKRMKRLSKLSKLLGTYIPDGKKW